MGTIANMRVRRKLNLDPDWELGLMALSIVGVTTYIVVIFQPWEPAIPGGAFSIGRLIATVLISLFLGTMMGFLAGVVLAVVIETVGKLVRHALEHLPGLRS